jgi:large subunit ribosomal protein L15
MKKITPNSKKTLALKDSLTKDQKKSKAALKTKVSVSKKVRNIAVEKEALARFGLHNLIVPAGSHKHKKLLGRGPGSGHGKTSTRGSKGQTSRSGRDFYLGFEGGQMPLIRRIPKRGFTSVFKKEYQIVNLKDLNKIKESTINPDLLEKNGLIRDKGKLVKILGEGEIKNPVVIQAHAISQKAAEKIKNSGGSVEIISLTPVMNASVAGEKKSKG